MKVVTKLLILLVILAICTPSQGEILVYNVRQKSWYVYGSESEWSAYAYRSRGYLIVDASVDANSAVDGIDESTLIEYGKSTGGDKWYSESDPNLDFRRVADANDVNDGNWALLGGDADSEGGTLTVLHGGPTKNVCIGSTDPIPPELAPFLIGQTLTSDPGMMSNYFKIEDWKAKLNKKETKYANQWALTKEEVEDLLRDDLSRKGYPVTTPQ